MKVLLFLLIIGCANTQKKCPDKHLTTCANKKKKLPKRDEIGVLSYCSYKYGHILGKNGFTDLEHCPYRLRGQFLQGYSEGRKEHSVARFKKIQKSIKNSDNH